MKLNITARHVEVPDDIRSMIVRKFAKLHRFAHRPVAARIILSRERTSFESEITLHLPRKQVVAREKGPNLLYCVESSIDHAVAQVKRLNGLRQRREVRREEE